MVSFLGLSPEAHTVLESASRPESADLDKKLKRLKMDRRKQRRDGFLSDSRERGIEREGERGDPDPELELGCVSESIPG